MVTTVGETFRLVAGGHLWMVISAPEGTNGTFVMVNMTSLGAHSVDTTCLLRVGDHPAVHHDSVIYYMDAKEWWNVGEHGHNYYTARGTLIPEQPLSRDVLRRVQDGALVSQFFKKRFIPLVQASLV